MTMGQGGEASDLAERLAGLSSTRRRVLAEVVNLIIEGRRALGEQDLARRIGVSRSPVSFALRLLEAEGFLTRSKEGSLVVTGTAGELERFLEGLRDGSGPSLYDRLVDDLVSGRLPETFSEAELMRRYEVARGLLLGALSKARAEGWVERQVGHGWRLVHLLEGQEAYASSYDFRLALEPAMLLLPSFAVDPAGLAELRKTQIMVRDGGWKKMTARELYEANISFHETLIAWSGNPYALQALERVDALRRLVEYRLAAGDRGPRQIRAEEHLEILDALERGERAEGARLLESHIRHARDGKSF